MRGEHQGQPGAQHLQLRPKPREAGTREDLALVFTPASGMRHRVVEVEVCPWPELLGCLGTGCWDPGCQSVVWCFVWRGQCQEGGRELLWHPWVTSFCADGRRGLSHEACTQCSLLFGRNMYIHIQTLKPRAEPRAAKQCLVCFSGPVGVGMLRGETL